MKDPAFKHYHARFAKPKDDDITPDMYGNCQSYYSSAADTLSGDSLILEEDITTNSEDMPIQGDNNEPSEIIVDGIE